MDFAWFDFQPIFLKSFKDYSKSIQHLIYCFGVHQQVIKCQFKKTEVIFFGKLLNRQSVVPNPAKIDALKRLPEPKTEALLQSFLGLVNYLSKFDPKIAHLIADLTHNLRDLLKKNNEFLWNGSHSKDFKCIIHVLCNDPQLLRFYRPELDLFLETNASGVAIGMALMQSESNDRESLYPIAYGS